MAHHNGGDRHVAEEDNASASISYSIKELLDGIKTSIDRLYGKLDTKADRSELVDLTRRMNSDSKRIDVLETTRQVESRTESTSREWTKWLIPAMIALAMLGVSIIQVFLMGGGK